MTLTTALALDGRGWYASCYAMRGDGAGLALS